MVGFPTGVNLNPLLLLLLLAERFTGENFGNMLNKLRSVSDDELTSEEIKTEINAVRASRLLRLAIGS